ncbi:MAG: ABC transporter substrate-binding protein [Terriglobales bacterium]
MLRRARATLAAALLAVVCPALWAAPRFGGDLVASLHSDPKTLNPITALDLPSQTVIGLLNADLIHINRYTQQIEPALATSWTVADGGRRYILSLRRGVRFSNGEPFTAADVIFSFRVYLDPRMHSPQRDLLTVGGQPIRAQRLGRYRVAFDLAQPDAAALRLFDGVAMLPSQLLGPLYRAGRLRRAWGPSTPPRQIAGLGPFRVLRYVPGQKLALARNPYYWRFAPGPNPRRLPYLNRLTFVIVPAGDAEVLRFQAGEVNLISGFSAPNFALLAAQARFRHYQVRDLGAGLEYDFLFFNLNQLAGRHLPRRSYQQRWFRRVRFRQAISAAIDRRAIVRLVFQGRATPLWEQVTPGEKRWVNSAILAPARSDAHALRLLAAMGFRRAGNGALRDPGGHTVQFSIITNPSNPQRLQAAALIQSDLAQIGIQVRIVPLQFQALLSRVFHSYDYAACLLGLVSGDADPNPEMNVWTTGGGAHLWDLTARRATSPWQAQLDRLMRRQMVETSFARRRRTYDQVQALVARDLPLICLYSPDVLIAADDSIGGLQAAVLRPYLLWNAADLYLRD